MLRKNTKAAHAADAVAGVAVAQADPDDEALLERLRARRLAEREATEALRRLQVANAEAAEAERLFASEEEAERERRAQAEAERQAEQRRAAERQYATAVIALEDALLAAARANAVVRRLWVEVGRDLGLESYGWLELDGPSVASALPRTAAYTPPVIEGRLAAWRGHVQRYIRPLLDEA